MRTLSFAIASPLFVTLTDLAEPAQSPLTSRTECVAWTFSCPRGACDTVVGVALTSESGGFTAIFTPAWILNTSTISLPKRSFLAVALWTHDEDPSGSTLALRSPRKR